MQRKGPPFPPSDAPAHVAIIMDGNGRWATARGLPRSAGHRAGAEAVRRTVQAAPGLGIRYLTLYAFSADNWRRPPEEVGALLVLLRRYLRLEAVALRENGVRLRVVGRRDHLSASLLREIRRAEETTAAGRRLELRIAVDYSARDAILRAVSDLAGKDRPVVESPGIAREGGLSREAFARALGEAIHGGAPAPDVDLLIRTAGERRLSDFLLWECAYAELLFLPGLWPDFGAEDLAAAVADYSGRERRFGAVPRRVAS